jgi:hypothetical protein
MPNRFQVPGDNPSMSPKPKYIIGKAADILGLNPTQSSSPLHKMSSSGVDINMMGRRPKSKAASWNDSDIELFSSRPEDRLISWNHLSPSVDSLEHRSTLLRRASSLRTKGLSTSSIGEDSSYSKTVRRRSSLSIHELKDLIVKPKATDIVYCPPTDGKKASDDLGEYTDVNGLTPRRCLSSRVSLRLPEKELS